MATGFVSGLSIRDTLKLGVPQAFTCPSGVQIGHLVYLTSPNNVDLARADSALTVPVLGVVTAKPATTKAVVGRVGAFALPYVATLTPGATCYLSDTNAGEVTQTPPSDESAFKIVVGEALTATSVVFFVDAAPQQPSIQKLATITGIDLTMVGTTTLYTVPSLRTFFPFMAVLRIITGSNVTSDATAGIGVAVGEDDVFFSEPLTNVRTAGRAWYFTAQSGLRSVSASGVLKLGVDVAALGASPVLTAELDLFGYLR